MPSGSELSAVRTCPSVPTPSLTTVLDVRVSKSPLVVRMSVIVAMFQAVPSQVQVRFPAVNVWPGVGELGKSIAGMFVLCQAYIVTAKLLYIIAVGRLVILCDGAPFVVVGSNKFVFTVDRFVLGVCGRVVSGI